MKYRGFKTQILVNDGILLKEYKVPDSELGFSTALKSYVFDRKKNRKEFSPVATFIAIPGPGTPYKIRYSGNAVDSKRPIKAKVFVDGRNDGGYTHIVNNLPFVKEGFCNRDRSKIFELVFDRTDWVDRKNLYDGSTKYGGPGVISVYFYQAEYVRRKKLKLIPNDLKQIKVAEIKRNIDITLTTRFDNGVDFVKPEPGEKTLSRKRKEPLAVIHINYRPIDWFIAKGILITQNPKQGYNDDDEVPIKIEEDNDRVMKRKFIEIIDE